MRFTCSTPTVMEAAAAAASPGSGTVGRRGSKVTAASICISANVNRPTRREQACCFCCFIIGAFAAPPHADPPPPAPALKGLTSLCGSRSLSCTDLINNFYQPLAQEISRGWAGAGVGGVEGEDRDGGGGGMAGREGGCRLRRRGVGKGLSITFQQHETGAYIMIRGCSHDHKKPIGEYLCAEEEPAWGGGVTAW